MSANSEPQAAGHSAMRLEGSIQHPDRGSCEYCVVVSITNEQGEKIARHVVGVGALSARRAPQVQLFRGSDSGARIGRRRQALVHPRRAPQRERAALDVDEAQKLGARAGIGAERAEHARLVIIETPRLCTPRVVMH